MTFFFFLQKSEKFYEGLYWEVLFRKGYSPYHCARSVTSYLLTFWIDLTPYRGRATSNRARKSAMCPVETVICRPVNHHVRLVLLVVWAPAVFFRLFTNRHCSRSPLSTFLFSPRWTPDRMQACMCALNKTLSCPVSGQIHGHTRKCHALCKGDDTKCLNYEGM